MTSAHPARRTRVLLADDHTLVRAGVRRILEAQPGVEVVGEVAEGGEALRVLGEREVDVLVLDLSMPGIDGFQVMTRARTVRPGLRILVLSMHTGGEYVQRAVREGADGYLLKDSAVQDLTAAIAAVMAGRAYYSPAIQRELTELVRARPAGQPSHPTIEILTEREREVLRLIAQGLSSKEIAARLRISTRTVESHRARLMRKLEVHSVALLTQLAIRQGLVEAP
jgi:DNA-binding NarL/FixJ family response regulator